MPEVFLDGEKVDFQGDEPNSASQAWEVVEQFVASQGRLLASVSIDGVEALSQDSISKEAYERMEFQTQSAEAKLLEMSLQWMEGCRRHLEQIDTVSRQVLSQPWSDSQGAVVERVEGLREFIEGFGILENFGREQATAWSRAFSERFAASVASIDGLVSGIQAGDCVIVSDELALELAPKWRALLGELERTVIPQLGKEGAS